MEHPKLASLIPWEGIEFEAQNQIIKILHCPELVQLAIMPDVHAGYDLCIGGVALMQGVISPSFVGYDIGCGMCHVNTGKTLRELKLTGYSDKEKLFEKLQKAVPAGAGKEFRDTDAIRSHMIETSEFHSAGMDIESLPLHEKNSLKNVEKMVNQNLYPQLGTLGGGNHFLEFGVNSEGIVGITIHSGSRRCGYDIASFYMKQRRFLPLASLLGQAYLHDMNWALDLALKNRLYMLIASLQCLGFRQHDIKKLLEADTFINETHNHAMLYDSNPNLVLHRKGATPANSGQLGVIPANQKDGVYITKGLGNEAFLSSASHGAGRKSSRKDAKASGSLDRLKKAMEGVVCKVNTHVLDEAPWAYKPIKPVLEAQENVVVTIEDHFSPFLVLKG